MILLDWKKLEEEAINHLQKLIRLNTSNPPGNEIEAIKYISSVLDQENISYQIFESAPGRANLIARLKGNGKKRGLLLTSHVDVVPAEKSKWKYDPFGAEIHDGCIWGRGAVDMKQMTAMELSLFCQLKRKGLQLDRDLVLVAVADEEAGCEYGSKWLVENKAEYLDAEYALNEVGAFSLHVDDQVFYPIGVAEKGLCWFDLSIQGDPGHGSLPHNNQANLKLAEGLLKLNNKGLDFHSHSLTKNFVHQLAASQNFFLKSILKKIASPFWQKLILKYLMKDKKKATSFYAMFHNTTSATLLNSGSKINVIPSKAKASIDGRILPGQTVESFLSEIKKVLGDQFKLDVWQSHNPPPVQKEDSFYHLLASTLKKHDPKSIPLPYLIPGFTDAAFYSRLGIKTYGFAPLKLPADMNFSELFHGHNERIPVEGFKFGLKVLWDVISKS